MRDVLAAVVATGHSQTPLFVARAGSALPRSGQGTAAFWITEARWQSSFLESLSTPVPEGELGCRFGPEAILVRVADGLARVVLRQAIGPNADERAFGDVLEVGAEGRSSTDVLADGRVEDSSLGVGTRPKYEVSVLVTPYEVLRRGAHSDADLRADVARRVADGATPSAAIKAVAQELKIPKNRLYQLIHDR